MASEQCMGNWRGGNWVHVQCPKAEAGEGSHAEHWFDPDDENDEDIWIGRASDA